MNVSQLETDYLVVGSGAVGMAFADILPMVTGKSCRSGADSLDRAQGRLDAGQEKHPGQRGVFQRRYISAAFIAHIEAVYSDEKEKNRLCGVVPLTNHDTDWIRMFSAFMMNQYNWSQDSGLRNWLLTNRLDGFSQMMSSVAPDDHEKQAILGRIRDSALPAVEKLQLFMAQLQSAQKDAANGTVSS